MFHFVEMLRDGLKGSTEEEEGIVLWYDACDVKGSVAHQSTLNLYNYPFFEVRLL